MEEELPKVDSILDWIFSIGENKFELNSTIDLRLVRKYSEVAEFEIRFRESILINDLTGESIFKTLEDEEFILNDSIEINLKIKNSSELKAFLNQFKMLQKCGISKIHYDNLIYLSKYAANSEQRAAQDSKSRLKLIEKSLEEFKKLDSYFNS